MNGNILIPFQDYSHGRVAGPATFMAHLGRFLDERGFRYSRRAFAGFTGDLKAVFFPITYNLLLLRLFKRLGIKIIQRLDGVYYPSKHGDRFSALNRKIKEIHNNLADVIVYQSLYSKAQCEAMLGMPKAETHVIINGSDSRLFYPSTNVDHREAPVRFVTTGNFRNLEMIEPIVKALDRLIGDHRFTLTVIGPITNSAVRPLFDRRYIDKRENMTMPALGKALRESDIFIYSHLNSACPNAVIEAICSGIPVVGFRSGAMAELLHFNTELLAEVSPDLFQTYHEGLEKRLSEKILSALSEYPRHKKTAMENAKLYSFEDTGKRYLSVFERILAS